MGITGLKKLNLRLSHLFVVIFLSALIITSVLSFKIFLLSSELIAKEEAIAARPKISYEKSPAPTQMPSTTPSPFPTKTVAVKSAKDESPWGVAKQVDENTWTMKVGQDESMATPAEIFDALNSYRQRKGSGNLTIDDKLNEFAQKRAETFVSIGKLDGHAGFQD
jgi:uncharacterized protein YkwD